MAVIDFEGQLVPIFILVRDFGNTKKGTEIEPPGMVSGLSYKAKNGRNYTQTWYNNGKLNTRYFKLRFRKLTKEEHEIYGHN